ncbi:MAG TPA: TadE/TadG family type IV pilus assembly protein [Acidobacteriaceae bacterium]|nr:TadE/TadG family type IV pilus assembly protein [Acidobacteriaceae bacterium]
MIPSRFRRFVHGSSGQGLVETALTASLLVLLLLAAIDFGRAFYMVVELKGAAHAGAVYGSQFPTDKTGMVTVATNNQSDLGSAASTPTADWGCECSDGTNATLESSGSCATPSCTNMNEIYYVTVTTTATYSPLVPWPGIPKTMNMSETVEMRSANF